MSRVVCRPSVLAIVLFLSGCDLAPATVRGNGSDGVSEALVPETLEVPDFVGPQSPEPACSPVANLEVVPLSLWGGDLDGVAVSFDGAPESRPTPQAGPGAATFSVGTEPLTADVDVSVAAFHGTSLRISYDGSGTAAGFTVSEPTGPARVVTGWQSLTEDGFACPTFSVYIGLDHHWFASGGRAPSMNRIDVLMNGEEYWSSVAADLRQSEDRITWSTWWWESDFELVRPTGHHQMNKWHRKQNTVLEMFEDQTGVQKRVLVNRFWGENSDLTTYINTDDPLRDYAKTTWDEIEVIVQANNEEADLFDPWEGEAPDFDFAERVVSNPRYGARTPFGLGYRSIETTYDVASWHQKAMVFDGEVAYVSGMNTKGVDWDSNAHAVFDERRMAFSADEGDREDVYYREDLPDYGPRRDYGARVAGPAARDVEEILWQRWNAGLQDDDLFADYATPFALDDAPAAVPASKGGVPVQVVATMPSPFAEQSVLETHLKAIRNAESYIFIEDQYFRAPILNEAILEQMEDQPELVLIVVTMAVSSFDGGAKYTYLSDNAFRTRFPDRYLLLQLQSVDVAVDWGFFWDEVDVHVQPVSTHSKLRLVDDLYVSVGSTNMNNRGYLYEGEMNLSVLDADVATSLRERVFENLVGPEWVPYLSDDPANNLAVLEMAAAYNAELVDWWVAYGEDLTPAEAEATWAEFQPSGFVYPLKAEEDYWFDVGPDIF